MKLFKTMLLFVLAALIVGSWRLKAWSRASLTER
jgi:hypothetical protein